MVGLEKNKIIVIQKVLHVRKYWQSILESALQYTKHILSKLIWQKFYSFMYMHLKIDTQQASIQTNQHKRQNLVFKSYLVYSASNVSLITGLTQDTHKHMQFTQIPCVLYNCREEIQIQKKLSFALQHPSSLLTQMGISLEDWLPQLFFQTFDQN